MIVVTGATGQLGKLVVEKLLKAVPYRRSSSPCVTRILQGAHAATCPVTVLRQWLEAAGIASAALFHEVDRHSKAGELALHRIR